METQCARHRHRRGKHGDRNDQCLYVSGAGRHHDEPGANPAALLTQATPYEEIGWAEGEACRYFLLAVIPWGNSTATRALEKALAQAGGDALINVTVSTNLYGFVPIYKMY